HRPGRRPQAKDFVQLFGGPGSAQRPWRAVASAAKLRPGHILAWLRPSDADENNDNTGHVMIVAEAPSRSPTNGRELLIRVIDSTRSPHADDSRSARQEGLGT